MDLYNIHPAYFFIIIFVALMVARERSLTVNNKFVKIQINSLQIKENGCVYADLRIININPHSRRLRLIKVKYTIQNENNKFTKKQYFYSHTLRRRKERNIEIKLNELFNEINASYTLNCEIIKTWWR